MIEKQTDGGPAFPVLEMHTDGKSRTTMPGMSMRDWFASHTINGLLLSPGPIGDEARNNCEMAAQWAYMQADAMLAERERKTK